MLNKSQHSLWQFGKCNGNSCVQTFCKQENESNKLPEGIIGQCKEMSNHGSAKSCPDLNKLKLWTKYYVREIWQTWKLPQL